MKHSNNKSISKKNGFTIIELMIAVAILAIVIAFGAPSFGDLIERQTVNGEAQKLAAAFKTARTEALTRAVNVDIAWNNTAANINVSGQDIVPGNIMVIDPADATTPIIHDAPYDHERLTITDDDGNNQIRFDAQGQTTEVVNINIGVCKEAGDDDDSLSIEITPVGRISVLDNDNDGGNGVQIAC